MTVQETASKLIEDQQEKLLSAIAALEIKANNERVSMLASIMQRIRRNIPPDQFRLTCRTTIYDREIRDKITQFNQLERQKERVTEMKRGSKR